MAYVNLQTHQGNRFEDSGVKKLLIKLVSLVLSIDIISNKMQLFHSTLYLDYAI